jgi:hypothetical protein
MSRDGHPERGGKRDAARERDSHGLFSPRDLA